MKRFSIVLLIVLLIAGLFVACNQDQIVDDEFNPAIDITSETTTLIPGSRYRTVKDTTIADRITIDGEGSVTIILKEGTTLTAEKGINVTDDQELQIEGTGSLVATGDPKSAGIGGGEGEDGGTIVIQGGEITANGGSEGGAGIGGGKGGKGGTTIIQKLDGKDTPKVDTKGGTATSHGIGNGEGATGDPEEVELDGVGLQVKNDGEDWEDYDGDNHKQYMQTFVGVSITFNANGGTGNMPAQVVHSGVATPLTPNTFTKEGMTFSGWNTKADGSGTAYANGASVTLTADVTLYALWATAPTTVTITFNANGGTGDAYTQTVNPNIATPLTLNSYTYDGRVFIGWAISAGGDTVYSNGGLITTAADITLYAKWMEGIALTPSTETLTGGNTYIASADLTIANRLYVEGTSPVTIFIPSGVTFYANRGISVVTDQTLNLNVNGTLRAEGPSNFAVIGGNDGSDSKNNKNCGTVNIDGTGLIHAFTYGNYGSGIGGGKEGSAYKILIENATVEAVGGEYGTGIGGGGSLSSGQGGHANIEIKSGNVTAACGSSGYGGTGIGAGAYAGAGTTTITISGGTVNANGSRDLGAGIGGGWCGVAGEIININISGETTEVVANGGGGSAGIGASSSDLGTFNINISGGTVIATGGVVTTSGGAGIGGGYNTNGGNVVISGGTVIATGGNEAANGIGRGSDNLKNNGKLTIGFAEIQTNQLVIKDGWRLYYGTSADPTAFIGAHDANDLDNYAKQYMTVASST